MGWGDSILIESGDGNGKIHRALIDSNDTSETQSSRVFLKRHFEKQGVTLPDEKPLFEFVMLSHVHTDHGTGLKSIMSAFGTKEFWYPKSNRWGGLADLLRFANLSPNVGHHQSVDDTKILPNLGDATMTVLWPPYGQIDDQNENNNSIVVLLRLGEVSFMLTGDAEVDVWQNIVPRVGPVDFFKIPHHGSASGTFDSHGNCPWWGSCMQGTVLGISSHIRPFGHPSPEVVAFLKNCEQQCYRTDEHYHITVWTDGSQTKTRYSHF